LLQQKIIYFCLKLTKADIIVCVFKNPAQLLALLNSTTNMFIIVSTRHELRKKHSKENCLALLIARLLALLMMEIASKN
jgi:hypothetical protein